MFLLFQLLLEYLTLNQVFNLKLLNKEFRAFIESNHDLILYLNYEITSDSPLETLQNMYLQTYPLTDYKREYLQKEVFSYLTDKEKSIFPFELDQIKYLVEFREEYSYDDKIFLSFIDYDNQFRSYLITCNCTYYGEIVYEIKIEEKLTVLNKYYYQNVILDSCLHSRMITSFGDSHETDISFKYFFIFKENEELKKLFLRHEFIIEKYKIEDFKYVEGSKNEKFSSGFIEYHGNYIIYSIHKEFKKVIRFEKCNNLYNHFQNLSSHGKERLLYHYYFNDHH